MLKYQPRPASCSLPEWRPAHAQDVWHATHTLMPGDIVRQEDVMPSRCCGLIPERCRPARRSSDWRSSGTCPQIGPWLSAMLGQSRL